MVACVIACAHCVSRDARARRGSRAPNASTRQRRKPSTRASASGSRGPASATMPMRRFGQQHAGLEAEARRRLRRATRAAPRCAGAPRPGTCGRGRRSSTGSRVLGQREPARDRRQHVVAPARDHARASCPPSAPSCSRSGGAATARRTSTSSLKTLNGGRSSRRASVSRSSWSSRRIARPRGRQIARALEPGVRGGIVRRARRPAARRAPRTPLPPTRDGRRA